MICVTRCYPDQRGFTLAELLIAIVVFAVVIGMVYTSYNTTFEVIGNADTHSVFNERARTTLARFTADLESYYAGPQGFITGEPSTSGEFRRDNLSFTSRAHLVFNKNQQPQGYAIIAYRVEEDQDSETLRLYRVDIPHLPGVQLDEEMKGFLLCDGLREVEFTYYDEDGEETDSWRKDENPDDESLDVPKMVRLKIGFADEKTQDETIFFSTAVAIPAVQ